MKLDSYKDAGPPVSAGLVNEFAPSAQRETPLPAREGVAALSRILAIDPPSVAALTQTPARRSSRWAARSQCRGSNVVTAMRLRLP